MELQHMSLTTLMQHYRKHSDKNKMVSFDPNNPPFNPNPDPDNHITQNDKKILGMAVGAFIAILVLAFITWIVAIVLLVNNWKSLPDWAKVLGVLGVLPFVPMGSIVTIIVVLVGRQQGPSEK